MFTIRFRTQELAFVHAFGISRWTRTHTKNVFVELEAEGIIGIGEAAPNARYQESHETAEAYLASLDFSKIGKTHDVTKILSYINSVKKSEYAAKAAVEMAFWDWLGKKLDLPIHKLWNAPSQIGPVSSFTIGIDSEEIIRQKVQEAEQYPILKVKLGTENDENVINLIRTMTNKTIWVDANEGWKTLDLAKKRVQFLADKNIGMIEQPMPADQGKDCAELKKVTHIPLIADEGFTGTETLEELAQNYTGINIKLMKIGSRHKAMQTISDARNLGLNIMVGCMIETELANTAAGILSMWADYADIDGFLLLKDRPFTGFSFDSENRVVLNDLPGLGVKPE